MARNNLSVSFLDISKIGIFAFVLYEAFLRFVLIANNTIMYGTVLITVFSVLFDMIQKNKRQSLEETNPFLKMLFFYSVFSALTTPFVARDISHGISSLVTLFEFVVVIYCIDYISRETEDYDWILSVYLLASIACAGYLLLRGGTVSYGRLTLAENQNSNALGLTLLFGIFSAVSKGGKNTDAQFLVTTVMCGLLMYTIIQTASRKAFLVATVFLVYWVGLYFRDSKKRAFSLNVLINYMIIFSCIIMVVRYFIISFQDSTLFSRLSQTTEDDLSLENRIEMYRVSFRYWLKHPIIGIGFAQFESYYGCYSHSTYAEIFSCGGLIGCLIFFSSLFKKCSELIKKSIKKQFAHQRLNYSLCAIMLTCELLMGLGQIFLYDFNHLFILLYIFGKSDLIDKTAMEIVYEREIV